MIELFLLLMLVGTYLFTGAVIVAIAYGIAHAFPNLFSWWIG